MYKRIVKRTLDFINSAVLLLLLSPLLLVISILVRVNLGTPIIFKQERPGKDKKIFILRKYRTMNDKKDSNGNLLPDSQRITKFGNFLRATSLDELPELYNILKGDMSFVGPRPLLVKYLPYYSENEIKRHDVRPGLTGLAQIEGRNNLEWDTRLGLDVKYVEDISLLLDIKILLKTIVKVLTREDIIVIDKGELKDLDIERGKRDGDI